MNIFAFLFRSVKSKSSSIIISDLWSAILSTVVFSLIHSSKSARASQLIGSLKLLPITPNSAIY